MFNWPWRRWQIVIEFVNTFKGNSISTFEVDVNSTAESSGSQKVTNENLRRFFVPVGRLIQGRLVYSAHLHRCYFSIFGCSLDRENAGTKHHPAVPRRKSCSTRMTTCGWSCVTSTSPLSWRQWFASHFLRRSTLLHHVAGKLTHSLLSLQAKFLW